MLLWSSLDPLPDYVCSMVPTTKYAHHPHTHTPTPSAQKLALLLSSGFFSLFMWMMGVGVDGAC